MARKQNLPQHIIESTLELAAERGWRSIALADIAHRAKLPLDQVYEQFRDKQAILAAFLRQIDETVLRTQAEAGPEDSARDRLFDVVMRRFDALQRHRAAVGAILRDVGGDPLAAARGLRGFMRSMALMLEAAGISSSGLGGLVRTEGLAAIYLYTLRTWLRDDSADMARTMAALDKALRRGDGIAALVWRRRRDGATAAVETAGAPP